MSSKNSTVDERKLSVRLPESTPDVKEHSLSSRQNESRLMTRNEAMTMIVGYARQIMLIAERQQFPKIEKLAKEIEARVS